MSAPSKVHTTQLVNIQPKDWLTDALALPWKQGNACEGGELTGCVFRTKWRVKDGSNNPERG